MGLLLLATAVYAAGCDESSCQRQVDAWGENSLRIRLFVHGDKAVQPAALVKLVNELKLPLKQGSGAAAPRGQYCPARHGLHSLCPSSS